MPDTPVAAAAAEGLVMDLSRDVRLDQLQVAVRNAITEQMTTVASTAELRSMVEHVTGRMVLELRAKVLAEQLPPQTAQHRIRVQTTDPRHATWWDHFKATYRQRWWMRWRRWHIRYVHTPVTVERVLTINVRDHWTYPQARIALPERDFGRPVMVSLLNIDDSAPWWSR